MSNESRKPTSEVVMSKNKQIHIVEKPYVSAFSTSGMKAVLDGLILQTADLYCSDSVPWVVGYSGGKDSTATLQLIWATLRHVPADRRTKPVHVISTDTLVENPIVAKWVEHSLEVMQRSATEQNLPIATHRLTPAVQDRYWVNLIGRGYPAPRPMFRWCTSRLKISPSNKFIREVADEHGEAILVLGTRKAESGTRKRVLESYANSRHNTRDLLSANGSPELARVWVYTPIAEWSNDDVWEYLVTNENPWGYDNRQLLAMYRGATADNECPLVVDTSTPSCGDSRFGCFVCTLVDKDKSMHAMVQNDEEKKWMLPLLKFRNKFLDVKNDWEHRDFRRMDGSLKLFKRDGQDALVHGPYRQRYRERLLRRLLLVQKVIRAYGPEHVRDLQLISLEELQEIRRIWVHEKHEIEDRVPRIYERVMGEPYPNMAFDEGQTIAPDDVRVLRKIAASPQDPKDLHFRLVRELLHIEQGYKTASRRTGIYEALERALEIGAFDNEDEALAFALEKRRLYSRGDTADSAEEPGADYEIAAIEGGPQ